MMVKICGITNLDDALAAINDGATALGFNFYPRSPRWIGIEDATKMIASLPPGVLKVGVFVDESAVRVDHLAKRIGLDVAQLHGNESPEQYPRSVRVWKAARVDQDFLLDAWAECPAEALLLDGASTSVPGGSGETFDWQRAAGSSRKIVLAGGLDADNVRQAIEQAHPWGVDACSRIERAAGRKDREKMAAFIKAALEAAA